MSLPFVSSAAAQERGDKGMKLTKWILRRCVSCYLIERLSAADTCRFHTGRKVTVSEVSTHVGARKPQSQPRGSRSETFAEFSSTHIPHPPAPRNTNRDDVRVGPVLSPATPRHVS